jgi:TRAP-type C4-dicarboxylate transport system substrate-binding protein
VLAVACAPAAPAPAPKAPAQQAPKAAEPAAKTPVTLRVISSWERPILWAQPLLELSKRVEQNSKGELILQFHGPEVVPPFEGVTAVSRGAFDAVHTTPAFYVTNLPEANAILAMQGTCDSFRTAGAMKLFDEVHRAKTNTTLVGCTGGGAGFVFVTNDRVESLEFFRGKKMRTTGFYTPIFEALGASPIEIPPADVYTALQRRVADGLAWPELGLLERKLHEVQRYIVKPTWGEVRLVLLVNVDSWNRLPPHLQKVLSDTVLEMEPWGDQFFREASSKEQAELQRLGMQIINLPPAEGERLLKLVNGAIWNRIVQDSPDWGPRLREAFARARAS